MVHLSFTFDFVLMDSTSLFKVLLFIKMILILVLLYPI